MEGLIVTIEKINAMLKESHKANVKSNMYLKRSGFFTQTREGVWIF